MEYKLTINGFFENEQELLDTVKRRKICYDFEPYNRTNEGELVHIGNQLNIYGTFQEEHKNADPDDPEFCHVLRDVRKVAEALLKTCGHLQMDAEIEDSNAVTYAYERNMRPDVTVHIPMFDHENFGHPIDDKTQNTFEIACKILEASGVQKIRW